VGDGATPFRRIADRTATTAPSLRAFLASPHGQMPDLNLTRAEMDDRISQSGSHTRGNRSDLSLRASSRIRPIPAACHLLYILSLRRP
jgi:hypothetical protein